jgi:uncharacterized protein YbcI
MPDSDGRARIHPQTARGQGSGSATAAISEQFVRLYLDAFGRGPTRTRTFVQPQFAVCVLRDVLTTVERSLVAGGGATEVEAGRLRINESIAAEYVEIVERETGRPVLSHLARTQVPAEIAVHFFLLDESSSGPEL